MVGYHFGVTLQVYAAVYTFLSNPVFCFMFCVLGTRFKEGCNINRSLFTLGQVIKKLTDENQK